MDLVTTDHLANIGYGRTALTRCIKGSGLRDDLPFLCFELKEGDAIYVCTDGLYKVAENYIGVLPIEEFAEILNEPEDDATLVEVLFG